MVGTTGTPKHLVALAIVSILLSACEQKSSEATPPANPDGLHFPVACEPGKDCWIARYVNHGQGGKAKDYLCGGQSQPGHKGTDIAIADLGRMADGVAVLAAKSGTILRVRDGMPDVSVRKTGKAEVEGQKCGNGIVLAHDNGDESQYCHLKNNSITVAQGDTVTAGDQIAEIGLSGQTEFPHLHYMLRRDGQIIDPFDGSTMSDVCDASGPMLWAHDIAYEPLVLFELQASEEPPKRETIWQAGANILSRNSPALVLTARAMHIRQADQWHMVIRDPKGKTFVDQDMDIDKDHQFYYRFIGRKQPAGGFMPGIWTGELTASRADKDEKKVRIEFRVE
ncbi:M23 family metallopeptidase [Kordiimonas aestuarii]|uniref:M23 family metallopeptidase n=1 Tax=Kordiimonas aestuarii TaxID=1005925 RepID=UPI0021D301C3|nr:M23 family metallopeptidase [Kordiimonas aestuarii]